MLILRVNKEFKEKKAVIESPMKKNVRWQQQNDECFCYNYNPKKAVQNKKCKF